jgi:hypothetical protein
MHVPEHVPRGVFTEVDRNFAYLEVEQDSPGVGASAWYKCHGELSCDAFEERELKPYAEPAG